MRWPREVAVFVFRGERFLLMRRAREGYWHVAAGVVEPTETFAEAAVRELWEETGLDAPSGLLDLTHPLVYPMPEDMRHLYPPGVGEITVQSFAVEAPPRWEPVLNEEHDEHRWCDLREALELLYWPEAREVLRTLAARRAGTAVTVDTADDLIASDGRAGDQPPPTSS